MEELRTVERFSIVGTGPGGELGMIGKWARIEWGDLKKGDIFRLKEPGGAPDRLVDGKPDVCVATSDSTTRDDKPGNWGVESLSVNGMSH